MSAISNKTVAIFNPWEVIEVDPLVDACRHRLIDGLRQAPMSVALIRYFEGGKMLRARLVFTAASAVGGDPSLGIAAAEAIELLHGASLVHDDIIDEASERRGVPALHIQLGIGTALALGDYLLLRAFAVMVNAGPAGSQVIELLITLSSYGQDCCVGQIAELGGAGNIESEEEYFAMVRAKTGSLFAAAATAGAIVGGGTRPEIEALQAFGFSLGVSFQIYDDMVEIMGERQDLGKSIGRSIVQERPLLPLIYLANRGTPESLAEYNAIRSKENIKLSVSLLKREGIFDLIVAAQDYYINSAREALKSLRLSSDLAKLNAFLEGCQCRPLFQLEHRQ